MAEQKHSDLFNSILYNSVSAGIYLNAEKNTGMIEPKNLRYKVMPENLPSNFDPRVYTGVPEKERKDWFYKNDDGNQRPVIGLGVTQQAGCGSCWHLL